MKELSIEEKAKAYDEAIERAKEINREHSKKGFKPSDDVLYIFPQLEENKDEKIRKMLIEFFSKGAEYNSSTNGISDKDIIAWLEEQGEHKYIKKDIDDAYLEGVTNTKNEIEKQYEANYQIRKDIATFIFNYRGDIKDRAKWMDYLGVKVSFVEKQNLANSTKTCKDEQKPDDNKGMNLEEGKMTPFQKKVFCIIDLDVEEEQGLKQVCDELLALASNEIKKKSNTVQQKQEWSEDDEKIVAGLNNCIDELEEVNGWRFTYVNDENVELCKIRNWLKSLKDRYTWKPSDEQMEALAEALSLANNCGEENVFDLRTLYEQLEKLK